MTTSRRYRNTRRSRAAGVGLLEVMIATLILGLVSVGMVEFFAKGRTWFDQEERKRVAALLAQDALERTLAQGFGGASGWEDDRRVASVPYAIEVEVLDDEPEADIKTITATVSWPAGREATRQVRLASMVYRN